MKRRTFILGGSIVAAATPALVSTAVADRRTAGATRFEKDHSKPTSPSGAAGGLEPYQPSAAAPWNRQRAAHLLRRTGFGVTWQELEQATNSTPAAIVDRLLAPLASPPPPGTWVTNAPFPSLTNEAQAQYAVWARDMQEWWFTQMRDPARMLREKMTLFWHNHFVSEFATVYVTQYIYKQNELFRANAFGDFRELTKQVTIDPAMLVYLDGATNKAGNPNENYGRELLELFTLGAGTYADGTPHYTERDIIELSRALTGWTINGLASEFRPGRFDNGSKTILGATGNFGIQGKASLDVIDHIFSLVNPDNGKRQAALFLCSKLYTAFVHHTPDPAIVSAMATTLVANDWRVEPVLRELLTSAHFFDQNIFGSIVKSPVEFTVGAVRELGLKPTFSRQNVSLSRLELHDPVTAMNSLSQIILNPPNVKGWPGGRSWISSATMPLRIRYSKFWVEPISGALPYGFDPQAWIMGLPDSTSAPKVLDHIIEVLLPLGITSESRALLLDELLAGGYEWFPELPNAIPRIRACLIRLMNLGEYQLM
jgi:uncharacterized protein (DUF1800 family)